MARQAPGFAVGNLFVRDLEEIRYAGRVAYRLNLVELTLMNCLVCLSI